MTDEIVTNTESGNAVQSEPAQTEPISDPESSMEVTQPTPSTTDSSKTVTQPENQMAQLPPFDPIVSEPEPITESVKTDSVPSPTPTPVEPISQPVQFSQPRNLAKELFAKAREAIQFRKRKNWIV